MFLCLKKLEKLLRGRLRQVGPFLRIPFLFHFPCAGQCLFARSCYTGPRVGQVRQTNGFLMALTCTVLKVVFGCGNFGMVEILEYRD